MLGTVTPLGERSRGGTFAGTSAWFLLGSTLGGSLMGLIAGGVGWLLLREIPIHSRATAALVVVFIALLMDSIPRARAAISPKRQVNDRWLLVYRGWVYGLGFGLQLGFGLLTVVSSAAAHATVASALLLASPAGGALIGASFGLVRGLFVYLGAFGTSPGRVLAMGRWIDRTASTGAFAVRASEVGLLGLGILVFARA